MPALARKVAPDYRDHHSVSAPPRPVRKNASAKSAPGKNAPRTRWHEERPASPQGRSTSRAVSARSALSPEPAEVRDLLTHFGHGDAEREAQERSQLQTRREARRRARLRHRPFHMSATGAVLVCVPLGLLASLLWIRSTNLSLSRRDAVLADQINTARFDLERTRKEIAAMNASPHIESWAHERGWRRAGQSDFDQVSDVNPSVNTSSEETSPAAE